MPEPSQELREAAKLMRERAEAATPGPWCRGMGKWEGEQFAAVLGPESSAASPGTWVTATGKRDSAQVSPDVDTEYIASMHPAVALPLAGWLDEVAADRHSSLPAWVESAALKIARAYLGTGEST
jgi:hypothetical protein